MLDPGQSSLYNFFKDQYADVLLRWNLLIQRGQLLKTLSVLPPPSTVTIGLECGECNTICEKTQCDCKKITALICALCRGGVKGPATICSQCGHGGHQQHMKLWFHKEQQCATGCQCECLKYNTIESWASHRATNLSAKSILFILQYTIIK